MPVLVLGDNVASTLDNKASQQAEWTRNMPPGKFSDALLASIVVHE